MKNGSYFISLDTHMNDIKGYEDKIDDYKRIIKRLKDENQKLEEENTKLNKKIIDFLGLLNRREK